MGKKIHIIPFSLTQKEVNRKTPAHLLFTFFKGCPQTSFATPTARFFSFLLSHYLKRYLCTRWGGEEDVLIVCEDPFKRWIDGDIFQMRPLWTLSYVWRDLRYRHKEYRNYLRLVVTFNFLSLTEKIAFTKLLNSVAVVINTINHVIMNSNWQLFIISPKLFIITPVIIYNNRDNYS